MNSNIPVLLGCHRRRLDRARRLRLPSVWSPDTDQDWLLFPMHLFPLCKEVTHDLYLLPSSKHSLTTILETSAKHSKRAPTIIAALEVLRDSAIRLSLPPQLATSIRVGVTATRFTLSAAQIDWLGSRGRTLILVGAGTAIHLYTPAVWARAQQSLMGATSADLHSATDSS